MDKRIDWIDSARGIAVLLVIWGHIDGGSVFTRAFYCFHIPLLFWISGFLFNLESKSFSFFVMKKIKTIALPCMLYSAVIVVFGLVVLQDARYFQLIPQIVLQIKSWPLWYMACLFLLNIYGYCILKLIPKRTFQILLVVFLSGVGLLYNELIDFGLPWNMDISFMAFPFFYFGFIEKNQMKKNKGLLTIINTYTQKSALVGFVLLLISVGIGFLNKLLSNSFYTFDMYGGYYNIVILSYMSAFIGIYAVCLICSRYKFKILTHVGKRTIVYFALHFNVFIPMIKYITLVQTLPDSIEKVLCFILTCLLSEVCYYLISCFKYKQYFAVK